jgi:hypothetical protein
MDNWRGSCPGRACCLLKHNFVCCILYASSWEHNDLKDHWQSPSTFLCKSQTAHVDRLDTQILNMQAGEEIVPPEYCHVFMHEPVGKEGSFNR